MLFDMHELLHFWFVFGFWFFLCLHPNWQGPLWSAKLNSITEHGSIQIAVSLLIATTILRNNTISYTHMHTYTSVHTLMG